MSNNKCKPLWGDHGPLGSFLPHEAKFERIDTVPSIIQAMDYLNKLLIQDQQEGHLSVETTEAINQSIAELSRAMVKATCAPAMVVTVDD